MSLTYDPMAHAATCDVCPLHGSVVVPPEGNIGEAIIAIVGEGPGYQEVRLRRPFIGPSGHKLEEICRAAGIKREQLWITNALLCRAEVPDMLGKKKYDIPTYLAWLRVENRRRKKADEPLLFNPFDCCTPRLYNELGWLEVNARRRKQPNGAIVMPLGNTSLDRIAMVKKISKWRGSPIPIDTFDSWVTDQVPPDGTPEAYHEPKREAALGNPDEDIPF